MFILLWLLALAMGAGFIGALSGLGGGVFIVPALLIFAHIPMGIAVGDYNRDGKVDFYLTSFSDDYNTLYKNDGEGNFLPPFRSSGKSAQCAAFLRKGIGSDSHAPRRRPRYSQRGRSR